jgi:hypothetical protein
MPPQNWLQGIGALIDCIGELLFEAILELPFLLLELL